MRIQCPGCGARYQFDPAKAGRDTVRIKCGKCAHAFSVTLSSGRTPSEDSSARPPASASAATGGTVLVVDDARFFRELVVDVLEPLSCTVLTACDGLEALEIVRRRRPELVVLDLNLPGLDGFGLMRAIRSDPALRGVRLMAMSAVFRQDTDVAEAFAAGADDFTPKSFRPEQLLERVRRLLENK